MLKEIAQMDLCYQIYTKSEKTKTLGAREE